MNMCEDYPCCGHELGDCDGSKYGSDEDIKAQVERAWNEGHGMCDHENGIFMCDMPDDDIDEHQCDGCQLFYHEEDLIWHERSASWLCKPCYLMEENPL